MALPELNAAPPPASYAAVTENARATHEALGVLRQGGNAADAAVTAALVAGVVSPTSSGIGGGCFIHYYDPASQPALPFILDARESAPAGLVAADFEQAPFAFEQRGKWVGVPGEVRGLFDFHARYGSQPWADLVVRAARVAERGFAVSPHLANMTKLTQKSFAGDDSLRKLWLSPLRSAGQTASNARLGATLRRIAAEGPKALYEGSIAAEMVSTVRAAGGWLSLEDLANYTPKQRTPLHVQWQGLDVFTMPPPSAGGLMLAQTLGLFSAQELKSLGHNTPAYQHWLAEAFRGAFADRIRHVGDPELENVPVTQLLSSAHLQARRAGLAAQRTHALPNLFTKEHGTHHLITADSAGRVVTLTTTVNRIFGAKLTAPRSAVVLNDELDDFALQSEVAALGLTHNPNAPRPGARPVSSMTPTLVLKDGQVVLAAGGSGGMNIGPEVTQAMLARLVFNLPADQAVAAERFQVPLSGSTLSVVPTTSAAHRAELERRGELVTDIRFAGTSVQMYTATSGQKATGADPRKHGLGLVEVQPASATSK